MHLSFISTLKLKQFYRPSISKDLKARPKIKECSWTKSNALYSYELSKSNYRQALLLNVVLWPAALVLWLFHSLWSMRQIKTEAGVCVVELINRYKGCWGGRARSRNMANNPKSNGILFKDLGKEARRNFLSGTWSGHKTEPQYLSFLEVLWPSKPGSSGLFA